jgi:hypothetical protein
MRRALAVVAALGFVTACGSSSRTATSLPGVTPSVLAKLRADALATARFNKDAHPSSVTVYASRRHEANIAAGAGTGVLGEQPVYLVVLEGNFLASYPSAPGPRAPERTRFITMILDRKTLRQLDYGFGGSVNTSTIGSGLQLRLG